MAPALCRYDVHYNMSVLQELIVLNYAFQEEDPFPFKKFTVHTVYLLYGLHYKELSFEMVNKNICLCTGSDEILFTCKVIGAMVSEFRFFKRR